MPSREFMERVLSTGRADEIEVEPEAEEEEVLAPQLEEEEETAEEEAPAPAEEEAEEEAESAAEEEEEEEGEEAGSEGEEEEEPVEPAGGGDEFYLGTYKNREEAEKGWLEKEQHISRQAEELHQMRERMAQYEGYLAALSQQQQRPAEGDFESWAEPYFANGQPYAGWQEVVNQYVETGDESYIDAYVEVWKEHDPFEASRARNQFDMAVVLQQQQALQQAPVQPTAQDVINQSWLTVAETDPDLKDPAFAEGVGKILKNVPALRAAALSGDPEQVASAIAVARDGYRMQVARTGNGTPRKVKSSDAERLREDKLAATVTTGDSAPERGRASTPEVPPELSEMLQRIEAGEGGFPRLRE